MAQLIEHDTTAYALMQGKAPRFKDNQRLYFCKIRQKRRVIKIRMCLQQGNAVIRDSLLTCHQKYGKHWWLKISASSHEKRKYTFLVTVHIRNEQKAIGDKGNQTGKKTQLSMGMLQDVISQKPQGEEAEFTRAWGNVRDQTAIIFLDPRAKANFITPVLARRLGVRAEEIGPLYDLGMANPCQRPGPKNQKKDQQNVNLQNLIQISPNTTKNGRHPLHGGRQKVSQIWPLWDRFGQPFPATPSTIYAAILALLPQ